MSNSAHVLKVNTNEGVLTLDGVDLMRCATSCKIEYHGKGLARVTLGLIAEVELEDLCEIEMGRQMLDIDRLMGSRPKTQVKEATPWSTCP